MSFMSKIEIVLAAGALNRNRAINEEGLVIHIVFLAELREYLISVHVRSRRFRLRIEHIIRFGIDSSVRPVLQIVELNHGLIDRNGIRIPTKLRLSSGFVNPVRTVDRTRSTPKHHQR